MKNKMIKMLLAGVLLVSAQFCYGQCEEKICEEKIKDFYVTYMQNFETNEEANVALMQEHMSPELIAKLAEYTAQYDADAVIHAQDVSKYGMESLIVLPLGKEDGYLVKYKWSPESEYTFFPVKAVLIDGKLQFLDIFPVGTDADGNSYIKRK